MILSPPLCFPWFVLQSSSKSPNEHTHRIAWYIACEKLVIIIPKICQRLFTSCQQTRFWPSASNCFLLRAHTNKRVEICGGEKGGERTHFNYPPPPPHNSPSFSTFPVSSWFSGQWMQNIIFIDYLKLKFNLNKKYQNSRNKNKLFLKVSCLKMTTHKSQFENALNKWVPTSFPLGKIPAFLNKQNQKKGKWRKSRKRRLAKPPKKTAARKWRSNHKINQGTRHQQSEFWFMFRRFMFLLPLAPWKPPTSSAESRKSFHIFHEKKGGGGPPPSHSSSQPKDGSFGKNRALLFAF